MGVVLQADKVEESIPMTLFDGHFFAISQSVVPSPWRWQTDGVNALRVTLSTVAGTESVTPLATTSPLVI